MLPGSRYAKDSRSGHFEQPDLITPFPRQLASSSELACEAVDRALFDRHLQLMNHMPLRSSSSRSQITSEPTQLAMAYQYRQADTKSNITARNKDDGAESSSDETGDGGSKFSSKAVTPIPGSKSAEVRPHAAVEKRYRQTVNTKLQQLYASIPESGRFSYDPMEIMTDSQRRIQPEQAAKPVILDKAIQYANHLIETYRKYDEDIETLRQQVRDWLEEDLLEEGHDDPSLHEGSHACH